MRSPSNRGHFSPWLSMALQSSYKPKRTDDIQDTQVKEQMRRGSGNVRKEKELDMKAAISKDSG